MEEKQIVAFNDINRLPVADVSRRTPPRFKQLKHMIGNTPLLAIHFTFIGRERVIYAKAEQLNISKILIRSLACMTVMPS